MCECSAVQLSHMAMGVLVSVGRVNSNLSTAFAPECNSKEARRKKGKDGPWLQLLITSASCRDTAGAPVLYFLFFTTQRTQGS